MEKIIRYNLFISHSWTYGEQYDGLVRLLNSDPSFKYRNYSVPKTDPIHNVKTDWELRNAIKTQMISASCVLILAGVYSTYSKWINIEIDLAKNGFVITKKIISIEPWGLERTSTVVKSNANVIVKWSSSSVIEAIKKN